MKSLRYFSGAAATASSEAMAPLTAYASSAAEKHRLLRKAQREGDQPASHKVEFKKFKKTHDSNAFYEMDIPESSAERFRRKRHTGEIDINFDTQHVPLKVATAAAKAANDRRNSSQSSAGGSSSFSSFFSGMAILALVGSGLYWKFIAHSDGHISRPAFLCRAPAGAVETKSVSDVSGIPPPQPLDIVDNRQAIIDQFKKTLDIKPVGSRSAATDVVTAHPGPPLWLQRRRSEQTTNA